MAPLNTGDRVAFWLIGIVFVAIFATQIPKSSIGNYAKWAAIGVGKVLEVVVDVVDGIGKGANTILN